MPDSIMYQEDAYVVLETNQPEEIMSAEELLEKLKGMLQNYPDEVPRELSKFDTVEEQAKHLMETGCELNVGEGQYLQWYVIRLEK